MRISKKTINGKKYVYATDTLYIARGKHKQMNQSLGPVDEAQANLQLRTQDAFELLIHAESQARNVYWCTKASHDFSRYISIKKIELLRTELFRRKQNIGGAGIAALDATFLVDFIYNSNKIEGSRVPRESIEKIILEKGKKSNEEVDNTIRAISFLQEKRFIFSLRNIERLHAILLAHEPRNLGLRKSNDIVVGNACVSDYQSVRGEIASLFTWSKTQDHVLYPPEHAFTFYYRFERIHPFRDSNGRVGRLLMNEILKRHRYHPMIIWNRRRKAHMHAFNRAMDGHMTSFFKFMAEQFSETHEMYLKKINKAFNLQEQVNSFLKASHEE